MDGERPLLLPISVHADSPDSAFQQNDHVRREKYNYNAKIYVDQLSIVVKIQLMRGYDSGGYRCL